MKLRIDTEQDIETLREITKLLHKENELLHSRLEAISKRVDEIEKNARDTLQKELVSLQRQVNEHTQARFGQSSERRPKRKKSKEKRKKQKRHGPTKQPKLPIDKVVHHLDEADQTCPACGGELKEWEGQHEVSKEIDAVVRTFKIVHHVKTKYRCECCRHIETALAPEKLIPGGRYSTNFAIDVAVSKYADHIPLARQVRQMQRQGLQVTTQTLWDQILRLAIVLEGVYDALQIEVLSQPWIGADETTWNHMVPKGGRAEKYWLWTIHCEHAAYYRMDPEHNHKAAAAILLNYSGTVVCDGHGSYQRLQRERLTKARYNDADASSVFERAGCWAHARRKFFQAAKHQPEADEALDLIDALFEIDRETRRSGKPEERAARAGPVVDELYRWSLEQRVLKESGLGVAIKYLHNQKKALKVFLKVPEIPLDNNGSERRLRGPVIGRKNFSGARSEVGLHVTEVLYSIMESCRLAGIDPQVYLRALVPRRLRDDKYVKLPHEMAALLAEASQHDEA